MTLSSWRVRAGGDGMVVVTYKTHCLSPQEIYGAWMDWWKGHVFDGFDFDLEDNDGINSPFNIFSIKCLETMGELSQLAHHDGFHVSIASPQ